MREAITNPEMLQRIDVQTALSIRRGNYGGRENQVTELGAELRKIGVDISNTEQFPRIARAFAERAARNTN